LVTNENDHVLFKKNFQSWAILQRTSNLNSLPKINVICHGYIDLDWANDIETRKSTFGYVSILFSRVVSWTNKKQTTYFFHPPKQSTWPIHWQEKIQFGYGDYYVIWEGNNLNL